MGDAVATMEKQPVDKGLAIMQTRCMCERTLEVPLPPPQTVTIELAPLYKGADKEERIFYLRAEGSHPSRPGKVYLYQEGPARDQSRIVVPGMTPPKRLR